MPAPYNYTIAQPQVSSYFDAFRQGRADRMAAEDEARNKALASYLPGALNGDATARTDALANASPDQQIALASHFAQMDAQTLAQTKDKQARLASMAVAATTPDAWALVNAEAKKLFPGAPDIPFEQRGAVIAKAQTVAEQLDQAYKAKSLALDESRTRAQNAASYAAAEASKARAAAGGGRAPNGYMWNPEQTALIPIPGGPADPQTKPLNDEQSKALGFANRIRSANEIIGGNDATGALTDWSTQATAGIPLVGNYMAGEDYQQADQATRDFINAQLRRESGAAIGSSEFENAFKQYIPQRGDGPKVLAQKKAARELALQNMLLSAGPAQRAAAAAAAPAPVAPAGPKSTPIIKTQAEFDALPSGTIYVEPDGKRYRKP